MTAPRVLYRKARWALRRAMGLDLRVPAQTHVPAERHGSEYGGWWVCTVGLGPDSVIYSIGIGDDITFDLSLIKSHGVTVHAFDPTPGSIEYLKSQQLPSTFKWHQMGLAGRDGTARFFPPVNPSHISHSLLERAETDERAIDVQVRRLSTIMRECGHEALDVLKMDIEGAEYEVLDDILDQGLPVRQILVEFHHRFPRMGVERTRRAIQRLNAAGYRIFFSAESGEEYCFIRDDDGRAGTITSPQVP